jgi:hypothetical protein
MVANLIVLAIPEETKAEPALVEEPA